MESHSKKRLIEGKKRTGLFTFITELKEELKKVSWTTRTELLQSTKVVVISVFVFGMGIYLVDLTIKGVLELFKRSLLFIFG